MQFDDRAAAAAEIDPYFDTASYGHAGAVAQVLERLPSGELAWLRPLDADAERFVLTDNGRRDLAHDAVFGPWPTVRDAAAGMTSKPAPADPVPADPPVDVDSMREFIVDARVRCRVVAPSLERALAAFSDWNDFDVDIYTEGFSDVRLVAPARRPLLGWLETVGRRGTPMPWRLANPFYRPNGSHNRRHSRVAGHPVPGA